MRNPRATGFVLRVFNALGTSGLPLSRTMNVHTTDVQSHKNVLNGYS